MWTLFKVIRWIITGLALWWLCGVVFEEGTTADGALFGLMLFGQLVFWPLALLWGLPWLFRRRTPKLKKHRSEEFEPTVSHDHIALDLGRGAIWVRDPGKGERYLRRSEVLAIRTGEYNYKGVVTHRLEVQVRDVVHPLWLVPFVRHSDRWLKSTAVNETERDEWFARMKAWLTETRAI